MNAALASSAESSPSPGSSPREGGSSLQLMSSSMTAHESMNNSPVYSVLKTVLDELDPMELQKYEEEPQNSKQKSHLTRIKDDLINLQQLQVFISIYL